MFLEEVVMRTERKKGTNGKSGLQRGRNSTRLIKNNLNVLP